MFNNNNNKYDEIKKQGGCHFLRSNALYSHADIDVVHVHATLDTPARLQIRTRLTLTHTHKGKRMKYARTH